MLGLLPAIPVEGKGLKALDGHSQDGEEAGKFDQTSNLFISGEVFDYCNHLVVMATIQRL